MKPRELRSCLKHLGLNQTEFAKRLQVNPRTVRRWLSGTSRIHPIVAYLVRNMKPSQKC